MSTNAATTAEPVRELILEAAEARFRAYGYRKTTMAEIAEDARMSAANLYRYFENKQDIAAACANRCIDEKITILREVVRRPGLSAARRLEEFTLAMLRYTHEEAFEHAHVAELVETIASERQELVYEKNETLRGLIAEILTQGNASGEFDTADIGASAEAVHGAIALFGIPLLMRLYPLSEFERRARGVVRLVIWGLARR